MKTLPCKNCICLAICKGIYTRKYNFEINRETPEVIAHNDGKVLLVKRCSLFGAYMSPMFDIDKNIEFCNVFNQQFNEYQERRKERDKSPLHRLYIIPYMQNEI